MITGTYKFILDGKVIAEQKNSLTVSGRSIAIKSLLGIIPNFAGVISYGIGNKKNTISASTNFIIDNNLQFEIGRTPVIGSSLELLNSTDILVYRGVIDSTSQYQIYEVGLFPGGITNVVTIIIFLYVNLFLFYYLLLTSSNCSRKTRPIPITIYTYISIPSCSS